jgi:hypothetical protein
MQSNLNLVSTAVPLAEQQQLASASSNTTEAGSQAQSLLQPTIIPDFEIYIDSRINFTDLEFSLDNVSALLAAMDTVYRVFYSFIIIISYWYISEVMAPPADIRMNQDEVQNQRVTTPYAGTLNLLANPAVNLILVLIFIGIITSTVLLIYEPFFTDYYEGCVNQPLATGYLGNGTILTRNLNATMFYYATLEGDSITAVDIDRINVARQFVCSSNTESVYNQQSQIYQQYTDNANRMVEVQANVVTFRECVNATKIDETYPTLAKTATNGSSTSVHASLYSPTCDAVFAELDLRQFDCNNIGLCIPECTGPDPNQISIVTYRNGCSIEYYFQAGFIEISLVLLAYVLLNIGRILVLRGLRRLFVDSFAITKYNYIGTTNSEGDVEFPIDPHGRTHAQYIKDTLEKSLKSFKHFGWYLILIAILVNIPWIYLILYLASLYQLDKNIDLSTSCPIQYATG